MDVKRGKGSRELPVDVKRGRGRGSRELSVDVKRGLGSVQGIVSGR